MTARIDPYWAGIAAGLFVGAFSEPAAFVIIGGTVVATVVSIVRKRPAPGSEASGARKGRVMADNEAPIPIRLHCPSCHELHEDVGEFATRPHHTHACQSCGAVWRPAIVPTVGVRFLPGFRDDAGPVRFHIPPGEWVEDGERQVVETGAVTLIRQSFRLEPAAEPAAPEATPS